MEELKYAVSSNGDKLEVYETYCTYTYGASAGTTLVLDRSFADISEIKQKGRKIVILQNKAKAKWKIKVNKEDIHTAQFLCDYANEKILEIRKKQREEWDEISKKAYSKENSNMLFCIHGEKHRLDFYENYVKVENNSMSVDYFYVDIELFSYIDKSDILTNHTFSIRSYVANVEGVLVTVLPSDQEMAKKAYETVRPLILKCKLGL